MDKDISKKSNAISVIVERKIIMFQVPQNGHIDTKYTIIYHGLDILENNSILHMYYILNLTNNR